MTDPNQPTITGRAGRTPAPADPADLVSLGPGDTVDRYTVHRRLGEGGMGVVYEAYDAELDRRIALKVVHAREGSSSTPASAARARLAREAQAMAKLSHPNVISVFDVGSIGDEVFIAMELVDGVDLKKWLRLQERSWREIVDVFAQAGAGLAAAHEANLVHRDFKPANALIGNDGRVRVLDFGLARAATRPRRSGSMTTARAPLDDSSRTPLSAPLTHAGEILGTPAYMAPEQHVGKEADPRTDQFSFCVSLWEALYGERPFRAETLEELALEVTQGKVREPPALSRVPRRLRRVLERGLSTDAANRYPTMRALLDDLASVRRPRRVAAVAIAGVVAVVAGGVVYAQTARSTAVCTGAADHLTGVWDAERKAAIHDAFLALDRPYAEATWLGVERVLDRYAAAWIDTHTETCKATRTRKEQSEDMMDRRMACLDVARQQLATTSDIFAAGGEDTVRGALSAVYELPEPSECSDLEALTGIALPEGEPLRAQVADIRARLATAAATDDTGDSITAVTLLRQLVTEIDAVDYPPVQAEVLHRLANLEDTVGNADAAEKLLKRAILAAETAGYDRLTVAAQLDLAWVVGYSRAEYERGHELIDRAEAILARLGGADELSAALAQNTRAAIYQEQGELDEARVLYEAVRQKRERALGADHPHVAAILNNLGNLFLRKGEYDEALARYERALAIARAVFGDEHPDVAGSYYSIGHAYLYLARYDEALSSYGRALAIREAAFGADSPTLAGVLNNMGVVHEYRGELQEAYELYSRSLEIKREQNPDHPSVANSEANLGALLSRLGRFDDALVHQLRALDIRTAAHSEPHADVANSLDRIGAVYRDRGELDEAMTYHQRAREIYVASVGADHPDVASTELNIGVIHAARGDHAAALAAYTRSLAIRAAKLGDEHPSTSLSRTHVGSALLELGRNADAVEALEAALAGALAANADQSVLLDTEFLLAKALWRTGAERDRARVLAARARDRARGLGSEKQADLAAIEGWLARPR